MYNLLKLSDKLYTYLLNNGISFNQYGYPIVPRDMFLNEYPDEMIPLFCRNQATHPKNKTGIEQALNEVPTVQPVQKTGRWIDDNCSECGQYVYHGDANNYCPNCGAKMESEE